MDRGSLAAATSGSIDAESALPNAEARPADDGLPASWRKLLTGTPREVLVRLVQDDPLRVRQAVAARLRAEALLLEADRVHLRAVAKIARFAARYRSRANPAEWIGNVVADTVQDLVREDHEATRRPEATRQPNAASPSTPDVIAALARPLGLDPSAMRAKCAAFNVLPLADRSAFFEIVLCARSLDEVARAEGESATEIARRARRALDVVRASTPAEAGAGPR